MASFTDRMMRAAKLDVALYEEVEADKGAMGQAMGVVILSSALEPLSIEMMLEKAPRLEKVLNSEYEEAAREALDKLNR